MSISFISECLRVIVTPAIILPYLFEESVWCTSVLVESQITGKSIELVSRKVAYID
jgi:hypothetical protein